MDDTLALRVVPSAPTSLDFCWYEAIGDELLRRTVGRARRVLDVGCGPGAILLMLAPQIEHGTGVDIDGEAIARAEEARREAQVGNVSFRQGNAASLPFASCSFDVVLCLGDVLCYPSLFGKHERAVRELRRVLVPGGMVVHESMNWDWEYRSCPPAHTSIVRRGGDTILGRWTRTAEGYEISRDYRVLPDTPLHAWIEAQPWPASAQGYDTQLQVEEQRPVPAAYLEPQGEKWYRHHTPRSLRHLYHKAGFSAIDTICYGQTYDIAHKAGVLAQIEGHQDALARAEADLASTLRLGSGPWLLLTAYR